MLQHHHTCMNPQRLKPKQDAWSTCKCASVCVRKRWVRRGYSSLSLRTKSLYICSYVVLKSYTFGLSGAGPGSFTWDPVPNERTSNPRLLQRRGKKGQENKLHNISGINSDNNTSYTISLLSPESWTEWVSRTGRLCVTRWITAQWSVWGPRPPLSCVITPCYQYRRIDKL